MIGLVTKLSLNDVLEPELVKRICLIEVNLLLSFIDLSISQSESESKEKDRLKLVPLSQTEVYDV